MDGDNIMMIKKLIDLISKIMWSSTTNCTNCHKIFNVLIMFDLYFLLNMFN